MVVPQITYGCLVWYTPQGEKGHTAKMCTKLSRIQIEAARIISGAYRATSAGVLDVELFILPMRQQLEKNAHNAVINIRSGSMSPSPGNLFIHTSPSTPPPARGRPRPSITHMSSLGRFHNSLKKKLGAEILDKLEVRDNFPTKL